MLSQVCEIPFRSGCESGRPNARPAIPNTGSIAAARTEKSLRVYRETFIATVSFPDDLLPSANRGVVHRIHQILRMAIVIRVERPHKGPTQPALPIGIPDSIVGRERVVVGDIAVAAIDLQQDRK